MVIPNVIMQTSFTKPDRYIVEIIKQRCPNYKYVHFIDSEIIQYFREHPLKEFPNIIDKFNSFTKGQHKADIFRYYYLYVNGGIFIDSDAMFDVNINLIIQGYDCVFIKSFYTGIFNGFIATIPHNKDIYKALQHAYDTEDISLQIEYHYFCNKLLQILNNSRTYNMKIYEEIMPKTNKIGSIILNDDNVKLISHYWITKRIPYTFLICTWYDDVIKNYAEKNYEINNIYSKLHNLNIVKSHTRQVPQRKPHWERIKLLLDYIDKYQYVMWIDADAFFYIDSPDIQNIIHKYSDRDIIFSRDKAPYDSGLNTGVIICKSTEYTKTILRIWLSNELYTKCSSSSTFCIFQDQEIMNHIYSNNIHDIQNHSVVLNYGVLQHIREGDVFTPKPFIFHTAGESNITRLKKTTDYYDSIKQSHPLIFYQHIIDTIKV